MKMTDEKILKFFADCGPQSETQLFIKDNREAIDRMVSEGKLEELVGVLTALTWYCLAGYKASMPRKDSTRGKAIALAYELAQKLNENTGFMPAPSTRMQWADIIENRIA